MVTVRVKGKIETIVITGVLTAVVFVLQYFSEFIKFGPFAISLVAIPIVVGAALCGPKVSTWLGFFFGMVVLMFDASAFLAVSIPGTVITVLAKGTLCGLAAGWAYKLLAGKSRMAAVATAAVICPIVNTGIFVLGCFVFFFDTVASWGASSGATSTVEYIFLSMIGVNFLIELGVNLVLCPVFVRIIRAGESFIARGKNGRIKDGRE